MCTTKRIIRAQNGVTTFAEFDLLFKEGREEAKKIKEHARHEEKGKLSKDRFNPYEEEDCIYGMMAFSCFSERAMELVSMCSNGALYTRAARPSRIARRGWGYFWITAFEMSLLYISTENRNNLIAYLKGETEHLEEWEEEIIW